MSAGTVNHLRATTALPPCPDPSSQLVFELSSINLPGRPSHLSAVAKGSSYSFNLGELGEGHAVVRNLVLVTSSDLDSVPAEARCWALLEGYTHLPALDTSTRCRRFGLSGHAFYLPLMQILAPAHFHPVGCQAMACTHEAACDVTYLLNRYFIKTV